MKACCACPSSCLRFADPGSSARKARLIPPSPLKKPVESSTGFTFRRAFVRESRALKACCACPSSCLRFADPGSSARKARLIPPSPLKKPVESSTDFLLSMGFLTGESGFEAALCAAARTRAVHIRSPAGCSTGRSPYRVTSSGKSVRKRPVAVFVTLHGSSLRLIPPSPRKKRAREALFFAEKNR